MQRLVPVVLLLVLLAVLGHSKSSSSSSNSSSTSDGGLAGEDGRSIVRGHLLLPPTSATPATPATTATAWVGLVLEAADGAVVIRVRASRASASANVTAVVTHADGTCTFEAAQLSQEAQAAVGGDAGSLFYATLAPNTACSTTTTTTTHATNGDAPAVGVAVLVDGKTVLTTPQQPQQQPALNALPSAMLQRFSPLLFQGVVQSLNDPANPTASISPLLPSTATSSANAAAAGGVLIATYSSVNVTLYPEMFNVTQPLTISIHDRFQNTLLFSTQAFQGPVEVPVRVLGPAGQVANPLADQRFIVHVAFDEAPQLPPASPSTQVTFTSLLNPEPWLVPMPVVDTATEMPAPEQRMLACTPPSNAVLATWSHANTQCRVQASRNDALACVLVQGRWCVVQQQGTNVPYPTDGGDLAVTVTLSSPTGLRTVSQRARISVQDINNNPPVFPSPSSSSSSLSLAVRENLPAKSLCGRVRITDDDVTFPPPVVTILRTLPARDIGDGDDTIEPAGYPFAVGAVSRERPGVFLVDIFTTATLDREAIANYTLLLRADDGTHTATAPVSVTVTDANDHTPALVAVSSAACTRTSPPADATGSSSACAVWAVNSPAVPEDTPLNTDVTVLSAFDADSPLSGGGRVFASLVTDATRACTAADSQFFQLIATSDSDDDGGGSAAAADVSARWALRLVRRLDYEARRVMRVCVQLEDAGLPPRAATVAVDVHVSNAVFEMNAIGDGAWIYSAARGLPLTAAATTTTAATMSTSSSSSSSSLSSSALSLRGVPLAHRLSSIFPLPASEFVALPAAAAATITLAFNGEADTEDIDVAVNTDANTDASSTTTSSSSSAADAADVHVRVAHRVNPTEETDCVMSEWIQLPVCYDASTGLPIDADEWAAFHSQQQQQQASSSSSTSSSTPPLSYAHVLASNDSSDVVRPLVRFVVQPRDANGYGRDCPRYDTRALQESRVSLASTVRGPIGVHVYPSETPPYGALYTLRFAPCLQAADASANTEAFPDTLSSLFDVLNGTTSNSGSDSGSSNNANININNNINNNNNSNSNSNSTSDAVRGLLDHLAVLSAVSDSSARNGYARNNRDLDGWRVGGLRVPGDLTTAIEQAEAAAAASGGEDGGGDAGVVVVAQSRVSTQQRPLSSLLASLLSGAGDAAGAGVASAGSSSSSTAVDIYDGTWAVCDYTMGGSSDASTSNCTITITPMSSSSSSPSPAVLDAVTGLVSVTPGLHTLQIAAEVNGKVARVHDIPLLAGNASDFAAAHTRSTCAWSPSPDATTTTTTTTTTTATATAAASSSASSSSCTASSSSADMSSSGDGVDWDRVSLASGPAAHLSDLDGLWRRMMKPSQKGAGGVGAERTTVTLGTHPSYLSIGPARLTSPFVVRSHTCKGDGAGVLTCPSAFTGSHSGSRALAASLLAVAQGYTDVIVAPTSNATAADTAPFGTDTSGTGGGSGAAGAYESQALSSHVVQVASSPGFEWACQGLASAGIEDADDDVTMATGATSTTAGWDLSRPTAVAFGVDASPSSAFFVSWPAQEFTQAASVSFVAACTSASRFLACIVDPPSTSSSSVHLPCGEYDAVDEVYRATLPLFYGTNTVRVYCVDDTGSLSPLPASIVQTVDQDPPTLRVTALPSDCTEPTACVTSAREEGVAALSADEPGTLMCRHGHTSALATTTSACCRAVVAAVQREWENTTLANENGDDVLSSSGGKSPDGDVSGGGGGEGVLPGVVANSTVAAECEQLCMSGLLFSSFADAIQRNMTSADARGDIAQAASMGVSADACFGSLSRAVRAHMSYSACVQAELRTTLEALVAVETPVIAIDEVVSSDGEGRRSGGGDTPSTLEAISWSEWTECNGAVRIRASTSNTSDTSDTSDSIADGSTFHVSSAHGQVVVHQVVAADVAGNRASTAATALTSAPFIAWLVDAQHRSNGTLAELLAFAVGVEEAEEAAQQRAAAIARALAACPGTSTALVATTVLAGVLCAACVLYLAYLHVTWDACVDRASKRGEKSFESTAPRAKHALQQAFELIHMSDLAVDGSFEINPGFVDTTEDDLVANTSFLYGLGLHAHDDDDDDDDDGDSDDDDGDNAGSRFVGIGASFVGDKHDASVLLRHDPSQHQHGQEQGRAAVDQRGVGKKSVQHQQPQHQQQHGGVSAPEDPAGWLPGGLDEPPMLSDAFAALGGVHDEHGDGGGDEGSEVEEDMSSFGFHTVPAATAAANSGGGDDSSGEYYNGSDDDDDDDSDEDDFV
ncbi:hypothetical protein PTSG_05657 [Salpingoeca rosetta]|uniref:Cadherin domain-containing protein n=1 Tax=Salpingoeca rosetta (strain ATCC 50818 / BSB-021) TaxID=946362 RepID=F2UBU7_SALR5|nr:uncharacterized protein PTSG_05657 [Salpingoeca rosetta]EGD73963.1 hypothetical protein PTSG_05657 [Salpingoeca rosetta]|eukprot:XP_004993526.1 hypothetical protein PTSG_05657 [Salpingoeca rosetta]